MIQRALQKQIESRMFQGRVIVLYGTRRVGKTTLARAIAQNFPDTLWLNCDEPDVRESLSGRTSTELGRLVSGRKLVVIDEAQRVRDVGITLKLLVENFPDVQVLATGSSSFDLANRVSEPLTGRKWEFFLHPLSLAEIRADAGPVAAGRLVDDLLTYGSYPSVYADPKDRAAVLKELAGGYLFHDILAHENLRRPELLDRILKALALQVGSEVSYNEIASLLATDKNTVTRYVELLEKTFVIFRLPSFARNLRNELKRAQKIYFWDLGIRNAVIGNFSAPDLRTDKGALWENFCVAERKKALQAADSGAQSYFWRTQAQQEIDYLEEESGALRTFEFKYSDKPGRLPRTFSTAYGDTRHSVVTRKAPFGLLTE